MQRTHLPKPWLHVFAATLALTLVSFMAIRASTAAFSAPTDNTGNGFSAGTVSLSDDDSTAAMFDVSNLAPNDTVTSCIEVTFSGTLDANVRLFGATGGTGLADYLDLTVDRGTGGSFGDCSTFSANEAVYSGTLSGFSATHSDFASGAGTWAPVGGGPDDVVSYRFVVTLQDDPAAQGLDASAGFTWEAQNS